MFTFPFKITWFCGTSEACRTLGHPDSVSLAIANIERDFLVVGVLEEVKTHLDETDGKDDDAVPHHLHQPHLNHKWRRR